MVAGGTECHEQLPEIDMAFVLVCGIGIQSLGETVGGVELRNQAQRRTEGIRQLSVPHATARGRVPEHEPYKSTLFVWQVSSRRTKFLAEARSHFLYSS